MFIENILSGLIKIAIYLGIMGTLSGVTIYFMKSSADAFQHGQISLGAWNRQLMNGSPIPKHKHEIDTKPRIVSENSKDQN